MSKKKICVVVTARPWYSRIKTALKAINEHPELELQLVVAASALLDRYGSAVNYIRNDGFEITAKVFNVPEGENLTAAAKTTGIGILELSTVFDNLSPDAVVTIADRFETMATAIAASYMNIPLAYIRDGAIYLTKTQRVILENSLYGNRLSFVLHNSKKHVNIDRLEDWDRAEEMIDKEL